MADLYVGIDQSYSGFGLAFFWPETGRHHVVRRGFDPKKTGPGVDRLITIYNWLRGEITQIPDTPKHVCMEGYNRGARNGREESGELAATVKLALRDNSAGPEGYPTIVSPNSLKKFVTSRGNASKSEMLLGVYKKWGADFTDDNEADAYGLARLAEVIENDTPAFAYEKEVLDKITPHTEMPKR